MAKSAAQKAAEAEAKLRRVARRNARRFWATKRSGTIRKRSKCTKRMKKDEG